MPRYAQLVMGPAGSGKSTYCNTIVTHCQAMRRTVHVVNLDPAAEEFKYPMLADIRELISVEDVMDDKELHFGPNGGLIFCMEYFAENFDWLKEQLDEIEDDYIIFDCPGQIELYTHVPVMRQLVEQLKAWNFYICGVFLIDAQFIIEPSKFVSGVLSALSAMVNLEVAHVNVISKLDLLNKKALKQLNRYLEPDLENLLAEETENNFKTDKFKSLNRAIARLIDDYSLVQFLPLDNTKEETIARVLDMIDQSIQYGEDFEPKEPKDEINDEEDETGKDIENYLDS